MFSRNTSRTAPSTPPARVTQPLRGTSWSITDEALSLIDTTIAAHTPERGGALITTRERIIVDFLPDPRPGEQVSYWHSKQLGEDLNAYLDRHPARQYGGTLHSHPGVYGEPSGPDHEAFANQLDRNPTIREALFPIVVQARRADMQSVRRLGDEHLVDLPHGTLAGYSAVPNSDTVDVRPAPMHVIPIRRDITHACHHLTQTSGFQVSAGPTRDMEIEGRRLPAITLHGAGHQLCHVVFSAEYPTQAPLLVMPRTGAKVPAWTVGQDSSDQLTTAIAEAVRAERLDDSHHSMEDRLSHHLPNGISAHYLVIGAGSVGSLAAELLVRSGVQSLTVVDFDTVELPNLSRTVYDRHDIGELKVAALQRHLQKINPAATVTTIDTAVQDLDLSVLDTVDVTVLASDDISGEFWLGHHLYHRGIPLVSIKMFVHGEAGEVVTVVPDADTACLRCIIGDPVGSGDRGQADYGTGRLVAAPALGVDIVATVARGIRVSLALGQESGPLADWLAPMITNSRTYFQHASVPDHRRLTVLRPGYSSPAFDAAWYRTGSNPDCAVCGTHRHEPSSRFGASPVPDLLPPGVDEATS